MFSFNSEQLQAPIPHVVVGNQIRATLLSSISGKRTQYVLDTLARDVKDPQITSHWNAVNSPIMSCVKINITTHGYDAACRTSLVIHVKEMSLKCLLHIVQKKTFFRTIDSEKILGKSWWTI
jgi:hypothetical protein